jgi:hypothetical protein
MKPKAYIYNCKHLLILHVILNPLAESRDCSGRWWMQGKKVTGVRQ